jgi:hypothetical protein
VLSPQPSTRQKMIRLALQEKAPRTYQELEKSGKLQKFLEDHDEAMMESYYLDNRASDAMDRIPDDQYERKIQEANAVQARVDEETLATWLDFSDPPESE